jgi:hypothetical protein
MAGSDQTGLEGGGLGIGGGRSLPFQLGPSDHQAVVRAGFFCLFGLLTVVVEAVSQCPTICRKITMTTNFFELK